MNDDINSSTTEQGQSSNANPANHQENTLKSISLSLLFKFIKPFNGSQIEITLFVQNCNSAFQLAQPSQIRHLVAYVVSQLSSKVVNEIELEDVGNWNQLKTKLKTTAAE